MKTSSLKRYSQLLLKSSIVAVTSALFLGVIHPIPAQAISGATTNASSGIMDSVILQTSPENLEISKSHDDLGETPDPMVKVKMKSDANFPWSYEIHLYDAISGDLVNGENSGFDGMEINVKKFAGYGSHQYIAVATDWVIDAPNNLKDFDQGIIGKSNILTWERKNPIQISLRFVSAHSTGFEGTWFYTLNQEINGTDAKVHLYNLDTGSIPSASISSAIPMYSETTKDGNFGNMLVEAGKKTFRYKAVIATDSVVGYNVEDNSYSKKYNEFSQEIEAESAQVAYERAGWGVDLWYLSPDRFEGATPGADVGFNKIGGGLYSIYVVENSTRKIIWTNNDGDGTYSIDMKGHTDVNWITAYVAPSYRTFIDPKPSTLDDLTEIAASSDGSIVDRNSGAFVLQELYGGSNPSEQCNIRCTGDPINNATGEFFDHKTDITTVGSGLVPKVDRYFSTMNPTISKSLGQGWRTNYDMKIIPGGDVNASDYDANILTTKAITVENENGSITNFYKTKDGQYESNKSNTLASLEFDSATNIFKYTRFKSKESFSFNSSGKLIKIEDDKKQAVNLTYKANGLIDTASDLIGNNLKFTYGTNGLVSSIASPTGKSAVYTYNTKKLLTGVKNWNEATFAYTYDTLNRIKTIKDELGGITTNTYNTANQVTKQVDPLNRATSFTYTGDLQFGTTQIKYPNLKIVEETYEKGQIIKKVENFGKANALTWFYSYDSTGHLTSTVNPDFTFTEGSFDSRGNQTQYSDSSGNSTEFTYDSKDNLVKVKDALGFETVNTYDSKNNLTSTTTPLGEKTTFAYTSADKLASVTDARGNAALANPADFTSSYSYLPNGLRSSSKDALGGETKATYNNLGQLTSTIDARNFESKVEYNNLGLPSKVIDPLLNETAMTYDPKGNILTSKNAANAITSYTYDIVGNRLTLTNALNEKTTYTYSNMDKPLTITLADGTVQSIKYDIFDRPIEMTDQLGRVTKQEFDPNSNLSASIDADGGRTEYKYNRGGKLESVKNPVGAITKYAYDKVGQLTSVTDPLGRVTKTVYDGNGRTIETIAADNTSVKTAYDSVGNVVKTTNEDGKSKIYAYDSLNRKTSYTNEVGQVTTYSYDANSNLTSQKRPDDSTVSYTYDARNLLTKVDYPGDSEDVIYIYDSLGRKTSETKGSQSPKVYTYDALNRITSQGKTGSVVSYTYDISGNLTKLTYPSGRTVDYGYDSVGQATKLDTAGIAGMILEYNKRGFETSAKLPSGVTETRSYDSDNRLTGSELKDLSGSSIYKRTQQYNPANEVNQKGVYSNGTTISLDNFIYDPTSKLTNQNKDSTGDAVNGYGYSQSGNLSSINSSAQLHDDSGKVTSSGSDSITYDGRNNRISVVNSTDENKNAEYVWAQDNLLKEITTHGDATATVTKYEYNAENLLEERKQGSNTDKFVWDTNREIPVMLSDGKFEYLYKNPIARAPFAQVDIQTQEVMYLHSDLTGSIVAKTSSSGVLLGKTDYSPYGELTDPTLSRFGYAGEWTDETTGYSFLRARWLDVKTGSFLSEDPLVQITQKAFGYTEGNPITQIDPMGLSWEDTMNGLRNSDAYKAFNSLDWATIGTIAGTVALVVGTTALIVGTGGTAGVILGAVSVGTSIISAGTATAAAAQTCINDKSFEVGITESCGWSGAGAVMSIVPFGLQGTSLFKYSQYNTLRTTGINPLDLEVFTVNIANSKFAVGGIEAAGTLSDWLYRGIQNERKKKNAC